MVKTKEKQGWLRIVEATITVLLILGVAVFVSIGKKPAVQEDTSNTLAPILDEAVKNRTIRNEIINNDPKAEDDTRAFIAGKIKDSTLNFSVRICAPDSDCNIAQAPANLEGDLYSNERIIASNLTLYNPKKLRLFVWKK